MIWRRIKHNLWQILICIDQLVYCVACLCFGAKAWADCTLSAAAHMWRLEGKRRWPQIIIDALFYLVERNHCHKSYIAEQERQHIAPSMRGD